MTPQRLVTLLLIRRRLIMLFGHMRRRQTT